MQDIDANIQNELNNILKKNNTKKIPYNKKILVLSGGGIRGMTYYGALKALDELGILENIHTFAVASVGILIAGMYLIGYSTKEMEEFLYLFDFKKLSRFESINDISPQSFITEFGVDDGENLIKIMHKLLKAKGVKENITLLELYQLNKKKLIATAACLNSGEGEYISYENYPNLKFTDIIRMTTCVPFFYTPVKLNDKFYVDGGTVDNYPINLFRENIDEVIGIYAYTKHEYSDIKNLKDFLLSVFQTFWDGTVTTSIKGFEKNSIIIYTKQDNFLDFDINMEKKQEIFKLGYNQVINFFKKNN
jgi:predicted acylesterase/phospholipase RssA